MNDPSSTRVLTFGDCYAGLGGISLGLENAGLRCAWQVEPSPYYRSVLQRHFPHATQLENASKGATPIDVLTASIPCKPQYGDWEFGTVSRLLRVLRPPVLLLESVVGVLRYGLSDILTELTSGGYDAEWDCLPSVMFGAEHRRYRVLLIAYTSSNGLDGSERQKVLPTVATLPQVRLPRVSESDVLRKTHGVPHYVERVRGLGLASYSPMFEWAGSLIQNLKLREEEPR